MTSLALSERLAEAAGPIVVKEVRQGLRARVFAIFFGLLLVGCLVVALIAAAEFDRRSNVDLGPDYFRLFLTALAIVEFFVIPYTAYRAMAREREDETWVLLVLTGLGPRRIVRGKVSSALAQGLLYASACAPFVLFSYYLNGIDLPTVGLALGLALCWSLLLVCLGVAAATQAHSRIGRALVHFLVLGVMLAATAAGIALFVRLAETGASSINDKDSAFFAAIVGFAFSTSWLSSEAAATGLSLPSENAARGPRVALSVQVLVGIAGGVLAILSLRTNDAVFPAIGSALVSLYLALCGIFAVSERDGFPPAFARTRWLFRPGALRSFVLVVLLLALSTAVWTVMCLTRDEQSTRALRMVLGLPCYVLLYLSLGVLLGRLSPLKSLGEPIATRVGCVAAVVLGTAVPMFLAVLTGHRASDKALNMLNPILGIDVVGTTAQRGGTALTLVASCAGLFGFLAWTVLSARDVERRA